jgi:putative endonuclease
MDRVELGRRAEAAVAAFLAERGFRIVARNVRLARGELDLVALRGGRLWFVETKCRARDDVGPPHRAVDRRKRAALFAAAREFVVRTGHRGDWGFLMASVVARDGGRSARISVLRRVIGPPA